VNRRDCSGRSLPIKKIAAVLGLFVMFLYLMISGASIPTVRSFIMNGIVFAAVLIDRLRISIRMTAIKQSVFDCLTFEVPAAKQHPQASVH
jgi:hypothetical protein